jgi:hypothetical protein
MLSRRNNLVSTLRYIIGCGLIAVGILWLLFFSLVTTGLGGLYNSRGDDILSHISRAAIAGPFITGTLLLVAGMVLREGKKYSVLFLRPFNSVANEKAMRAFSRKLGRRFTAIALDDGAILPAGRSLIRALVALLLLGPASLVLFFIGAILLPMGGSDFGSHLPAILVLLTAIFLVRTAWSGIVQPQKRPVVDSHRALRRAILISRAQSTWGLRMLIPRVIIIKTDDEMWKPTVTEVGKVADVAIIDVSRYGKGIEWEVDYLKASKPTRSLVITSRDAPTPPDQCEFAGPIETYATSPAFDKAFESRLRERLLSMLQ